jgi:hypothetical protein
MVESSMFFRPTYTHTHTHMNTWIRVRVKTKKNEVRKGERVCTEEGEGDRVI